MIRRWAFATALLAAAGAAQAVEFSVDLGDFAGPYKIDGQHFNETHTYDLAPGERFFTIGPGLSFFFTLDENRTITPRNEANAEGGTGVLKLRTRAVSVERGAYKGDYGIARIPAPPEVDGIRTYHLIPELGRYPVSFSPGNSFFFTLADNGNVTPENPVTADGGQDELTFKTVPVRIERGTYRGSWWLNGPEPFGSAHPTSRTLDLVPGVAGYTVAFAPSNAFLFALRDDGTVDMGASQAAKETAEGLVFEAVSLPVNPVEHDLPWWIAGPEFRPGNDGPRNVTLVRDVPGWILSLSSGRSVRFDLDRYGDPLPPLVGIVDEQVVLRQFELGSPGAGAGAATCQFTATATVMRTVSPFLEEGDTIAIEADLRIDPADIFPHQPLYAIRRWTGELVLRDQWGAEATAQTGVVWVVDDDDTDQSMIRVFAERVEGTLANEDLGPEAGGVVIDLSGAGDVLESNALPLDLTVWNALKTSRFMALYGHPARPFARVSPFSFDPPGCL